MISLGARVILFLSSYLPLWLIYTILYCQKQATIAMVSVIISIIGFIGLIAILWFIVKDTEPVRDRVVQSRLRGDEVMGYIAGYLLPFLGVDLTSRREVVAVTLFLIVLCYLYVTTDMLYINPMLNLLGYNVYEVTLETEGVHPVISRKRPRQGDALQIVRLTRGIFIARGGI